MIERNYYKIISYILGLLIIMPSTIKIFGISIFKISMIIAFALIVYLYVKKIIKKEDIFNKFFIANIAISIAILITILLNITNMKFNDYFEIIRFIGMAQFTIITIGICKEERNFKYLLKVIIVMLTIVAIFGIIQYFNPFNINKLYLKYYAPTQQTTLIDGYPTPRIIGTKTGPASMGVIMSIGIFFNLLNYKYVKENKKKLILCIISVILLFVSLMLTLSRTTQIAFIIAMIIFAAILMSYKKGLKYSILTILISMLIIQIALIFLPKSLTWRVLQVFNLSEVKSWTARTEKWSEYFDIISKNILFGIGSIKNMKLAYVDSEHITILLQYGITGFISYIIMLLTPLFNFIKKDDNKHIFLFYVPILIFIIILNISAGSFLSFDTGVIIYIIIGVILSNKDNFLIENKALKGVEKK